MPPRRPPARAHSGSAAPSSQAARTWRPARAASQPWISRQYAVPTMSPSSCLSTSDLLSTRAVSASRLGSQYSAIPEIA